MNFGFDPNQAAGVAGKITSAVGPMFWIMIILALGGIGRMVFVAWGDKFQISRMFENFSGYGLIAVAIGLMLAGVFVADREVRAWVIIQQKIIDPVLVNVLGRDSCNPENDRFCVVVWTDSGREVIVKWHDKRVDALQVYGDYEFSLTQSARPLARPERAAAVAAPVAATGSEG